MKINEIITESKEKITEHLQLNEIDPRNYDSDEDYYNDLHGEDDEEEYDGDGEDDDWDDSEEPEAHYEKHIRVHGLGEADETPGGNYGMPGFGNEGQVKETIVKKGGKYEVQSKSGKNLGQSDTKAGAVKRLGQVEWFKKHK
jgi:hypothetical protein